MNFKSILLSTFIISFCFNYSKAQIFKGILKPIEKIEIRNTLKTSNTYWKWRINTTLPAVKIIESTRQDAKVDASLLTSAGGGISYQKLTIDSANHVKSIISFSPLTLLLSGNIAKETNLDLSYMTTVGFFNNVFMAGIGYDLGSVGDRSRWFIAVSVGININNN